LKIPVYLIGYDKEDAKKSLVYDYEVARDVVLSNDRGQKVFVADAVVKLSSMEEVE
jgi:hypothetical protein